MKRSFDENIFFAPSGGESGPGASAASRLMAMAAQARQDIIVPFIHAGFDATASRKKTWEAAQDAQDRTIKFLGDAGEAPPQIRVAYVNGTNNFDAIGWSNDNAAVRGWMRAVECVKGSTRVHRLLADVHDEIIKGVKIAAAMITVDSCETDRATLRTQAKQIGDGGTPIFVLHEVHNPDRLTATEQSAQTVFEDIARISGGKYVAFRSGVYEDMLDVTKIIVAKAYGPTSRAAQKLLAGQAELGRLGRTFLIGYDKK